MQRKWSARGTQGVVATLVAVLGALGAVAAAHGQPPVYDLEVRGQGFRRITIQLPEPTLASTVTEGRGTVAEAQETLARDLIYSGFFYVMDQYASPYLPRGVSRAWNVSDERPDQRPHRVEAQWKSEAGGLVADLRLLDGGGNQLIGKRYQVQAGDAGPRPAMHHFADAVVTQLTGLPGCAQTKIAFARLTGQSGEIYVVDYDGFGERALTAQKRLTLSPCWGGGSQLDRVLRATSRVSPSGIAWNQGTRRLVPSAVNQVSTRHPIGARKPRASRSR